MALSDIDVLAARHLFEFVLAILVLLVTLVLPFIDPGSFETVGTVIGALVAPATVLLPGLLALSVLFGVMAHAWRIGVSWSGPEDRTRPRDKATSTLVASAVFGLLAVHTLWWVVGSIYVLFLVETGGVLIAPLFALLSGSVLAVLVLLRTVLNPDETTTSLLGLSGG